jgi:hypothetical protein
VCCSMLVSHPRVLPLKACVDASNYPITTVFTSFTAFASSTSLLNFIVTIGELPSNETINLIVASVAV